MEKDVTLQQSLNKFIDKNEKYFSKSSISDEGKEFLKCHDVAHVVFGCDTSIHGEGLVKIWTTFGSTLSFWKVVKGYKEVSAFELFSMYSFRHFIKNIVSLLITIPKVIIRAKRMKKPWPFSNYHPYLNTPVSEIRKEFNIQVVE